MLGNKPCGKCCLLVDATVTYSGSTVKLFDLVCSLVLLLSMIRFHLKLHRSSKDFAPVYNTCASLFSTIFAISLGLLILPGSPSAVFISRCIFVAQGQGFFIHWVWFWLYMWFGRQMRPAAIACAGDRCSLCHRSHFPDAIKFAESVSHMPPHSSHQLDCGTILVLGSHASLYHQHECAEI